MINMLRLLLLLILATAIEVQGQCSLNQAGVEGSNGIFTYLDARGNIELQKTTTVAAGVTLSMHCANNQVLQTTCQRNRRLEPPLPLRCNNALPPPGVIMVQQTDVSCPATMYAIGYTINNRFLELYRACYDRQSVRSYFTEATLYSKSFFPRRPCTEFTTDGLISPAQERSFTKFQIHAAFSRIYGQNQNYIRNQRDLVINRGHLTASADFLFGDQSCSTFKYVNVVPQFSSINDGNWETIERWVRRQIPRNSAWQVRTGAQGVLNLPDATPRHTLRPAYLYGNNQNPVPEWMYKVVRNSNNQPIHAFATYNNMFAAARPAAPAFCQIPIQCPMDLVDSAVEGYTYCCDPAHFNV